MKFTYIKTGDDISEREALVINKPSQHYLMFEVDNKFLEEEGISKEDLMEAFKDFEKTRKEYMYNFASAYGLHIKYFNPEKMQDIQND